jgi:hypothetical protein
MATIGSKYQATKHLDIKDLAKLLRKDYKEAYPQYKINVSIERYAGGQSFHIKINNTGITDKWSAEARNLEREIREVAYQYRWDDSDPMTDYAATNFYANDVRVES